jgi:hypothetical protein
MWDVGRSASTDVLSGTSSLVGAPDEVFGTHSYRMWDVGRSAVPTFFLVHRPWSVRQMRFSAPTPSDPNHITSVLIR